MYQEQEGVPSVRIMGQFSPADRAIYNELEQAVRNPECTRDWLVKKRLQSVGRGLTNREIYSYFGDCSIVKNQKLADVIKRHCLTIEIMGDSKAAVSDTLRGNFPII